MGKVWQKSSNNYFLRDTSANVDRLENKVYNLLITPLGELYLSQAMDNFKFDFKVYGLERDFINRTIKTYKNSTGNMGVLLNGVKGTGKTITAEILCNELELPVILMPANYGNVNIFLASIQQDLVVFMDEFEKVFKSAHVNEDEDGNALPSKAAGTSLLSLMDGNYKTAYRKVFLLTTNKPWVDDNLLNRPGRIRYRKNFLDLALDQIYEILDDCLVEKQFRKQIIDFIKPLKLITVDIVKAVVSEVNIHKEEPLTCCVHLNVEKKNDEYDVYDITDVKKAEDLKDIRPFASNVRYDRFYGVLDTDDPQNMYMQFGQRNWYVKSKPDSAEHIYVCDLGGGNIKKDVKTFKIVKRPSYHYVFM